MNLKTACQISMIMVVTVILMILIAYPLSYIPQIKLFHVQVISNAIDEMLKLLLHPGGFMIFLVGFRARLKDSSDRSTILFTVAGIHILLGIIITSMPYLLIVLQNRFAWGENTLYLTLFTLMLMSGLLLSAFVFLQGRKIFSAKPLARIVFICNLILIGLIIINNLYFEPWCYRSILYAMASIIAIASQLTYLVAVSFFLYVFLQFSGTKNFTQINADSVVEPAL